MRATISHKGVEAAVAYDRDGGTLTATAINTARPFDVTASTVATLRQTFRAAVDDYLDLCREYGALP